MPILPCKVPSTIALLSRSHHAALAALLFGWSTGKGDAVELILASSAEDGSIANLGVETNSLRLSADGSLVFFRSAASNLVPGDGNGVEDIFVRKTRTGEIARVNVSEAGVEADAAAINFDITPDGRFVAIETRATNLLPAANPSGEHWNIFVKDLETGKVSRATTDATGAAEGENIDGSAAGSRFFEFRGLGPSLSDNGRLVAFRSETSTFLGLDERGIVKDINNGRDIYVKDLQSSEIVRASSDANNTQVCAAGRDRCGKVTSLGQWFSGDGSTVMFAASLNNLVGGDTNGATDLFVKDLDSGQIVRANTSALGAQDEPSNAAPLWISTSGRHVAFNSRSSTLDPGDVNEAMDLFFKDLETGAITRVPGAADHFSDGGGSFVTFSTSASLVDDDGNDQEDVYRRNIGTGALVRVSVDAEGRGVTGSSFGLHDVSSVTTDGQLVVFRSSSSALIPGDSNNQIDIFLKDLESGEVALLSAPNGGGESDGESQLPVISADGSTVAFISSATNLVPGDTNSRRDVFVAILKEDDPRPDGRLATGESKANKLLATHGGDPISTASGELYEPLPADLDLGGPMPLIFRRYYAAFLRRSFILGDLGSNWRHNFDARLYIVGNTAKYVSHEGRVTNFLKEEVPGPWVQQNHPDTPYQLQSGPDQDAVLYDPVDDRIYTFDFTTNNLLMGKLATVSDGRGNTHTVSYDEDTGQIETVADGLGRVLTFHYNEDTLPKIQVVTDGTRSISFEYTDDTDSEALTRATDVRGGITVYSYKDTSGVADHALLTHYERPRGNVPFQQTFDSEGRVIEQRDSDENTLKLAYDTPGPLQTTLTDPLDETRIHFYDSRGGFNGMEDQAGDLFTLTNNDSEQRTSITDRLGDITSYTFQEGSGRLSGIAHADGTTTNYTYTPREFSGLTLYDLTRVNRQDQSALAFSYDAFGNVLTQTDAGGNDATFTYNNRGQVLTSENPLSGTVTFTYHDDGTLATVKDPATNTRRLGYDDLRRLNLVTHPDDAEASFTYDDANNLLTYTNESGDTTTFTYDANGNLETVEDPENAKGEAPTRKMVFTHDGNDRLLTATDPAGGQIRLSYHPLGGIASVTDPNDNETTLGYDKRGRLTTVTDPLSNSWKRTYDAEGVLASITDPLDNETTFESDEMGRFTSATSPLGHTVDFSYDGLGRMIETTDPLGLETTLQRDARGLLTRIELPGGTVAASYTHNKLGQVTETIDAGDNRWRRAYDKSGRQTSSTDPLDHVRSTAHDDRNRPSRVTYPGGFGTQDLEYDPAGRLLSRSYSDGTEIHYAYTANGRLASASDGTTDTLVNQFDANDRNINCNGIAATYDPGGRLKTLTLAPGKAITYEYDANDRLIKVSDWRPGEMTFAYDAAGRHTAITRPNGVHQNSSYDKDSRLTGLTEGDLSSVELTRDAGGRITNATRQVPEAISLEGLAERTSSYDAASQVEGVTHDALGRMTVARESSYRWDLASRLLEYTRGGQTVTATYDVAGFRLTRATGGETRSFVWNYIFGLPSISIEKHDGVIAYYYVHAPEGQLLYRIDAVTNAREYYHFDEMGNTIFLTNDAGEIIASYAYTPYGELMGSTGDLDNPFTWQGQMGVMDDGNGLYYIRARYYDSAQARFISRDPIKGNGPLNVNPYQYVYGNPLKLIDVDGRQIDKGDFRLGLSGGLFSYTADKLPEVSDGGAREWLLAAGDGQTKRNSATLYSPTTISSPLGINLFLDPGLGHTAYGKSPPASSDSTIHNIMFKIGISEWMGGKSESRIGERPFSSEPVRKLDRDWSYATYHEELRILESALEGAYQDLKKESKNFFTPIGFGAILTGGLSEDTSPNGIKGVLSTIESLRKKIKELKARATDSVVDDLQGIVVLC